MTRSFDDACRFLFPRTGGATEWSLGPTRALLASVGHPERQFPAIHIAGSNGKGSVAVMVYGALRASGARAALYTSPHLVDVRERIIVNDQPISEAAFAAWTDRLAPVIEAEDASFFEAGTAIALADFAARGADIAVVEAGLGGRLDATNAVVPSVSVVTRIAREHTDYLGEHLADIAWEKAGIAKPGVPCIIGEPDPDLAGTLETHARAAGAQPVRIEPAARYDGRLALAGKHQRRNAAVARRALEALPPSWRPDPPAVERGFATAFLPGRFEQRGRWILDVAHNPDAVTALTETLAEIGPPRPIHALACFLDDKAWAACLELLGRSVDRLWATDAPSAPRARRWNLAAVARALPASGRIQPDFERALDEVAQGAATVLACGSFYTVGDIMSRLPGFPPLG